MAKKKKPTRGQRRLRLSRTINTRVVYCGDNLDYLRKMPDSCVDLVYIDPPFNSNRNYEVFWGESGEKRSFEDRHASIEAYIAFMRPRCQEMYRILCDTGSFYFHCDWHASHYIKVMLDSIFGANQFINEVVWKRSDAHSDGKQGSKHFGRIHDNIMLYAKGKKYTFNTQYRPLPESTSKNWYRYVEEDTGRRYNKADLTAAKGGGDTSYEWKGVKPPRGRYWAYSRENMIKMEAEGRIVYSRSGRPYMKRYLDESKGVPLQSWWDDISMLRGISRNNERVGYPTQKPAKLLERIIKVSSNPGDVILDAFCGCGTTIEAAELNERQWIGIDISPRACKVMSKRLRDRCKIKEDESLWLADRGFVVKNLPWTEEKLKEIPPFEFEEWAVIALNGQPNARKVGDGGIDGRIYPASDMKLLGASGEQLEFTVDMYFPVQVKQKQVGRPDIQQFRAVMEEHDSPKGFMVGFSFSKPAEIYARKYEKDSGRELVLVTVGELLDSAEQKRYA